jgi:CDP-paratose 2-epimerase
MNILISGGAGFIGCNWASRLLEAGENVTIFDNLSRKGASANLEWLKSRFDFNFFEGDVRDYSALSEIVKGKDAIYHLAAQVAVTTSVTNPREDFEINSYGTFNILEAARRSGSFPLVVYASTNKVYGGMEEIAIIEDEKRYRYRDYEYGIPETYSLDFHSPYGCSKGSGDQYTRDYYRIYGLPTVVFRQSCIYGLRQFGVEDQGWLAHFVIAAAKGKEINIYGDGKQIRDMLWVDDLLDVYEIALRNPDKVKGEIYNIGGGPKFTLSIWMEVKAILEELAGRKIMTHYGDWRPGDQKVYVSDIRKAERDLGWTPKTSPQEGIVKLWNWVNSNLTIFQ